MGIFGSTCTHTHGYRYCEKLPVIISHITITNFNNHHCPPTISGTFYHPHAITAATWTWWDAQGIAQKGQGQSIQVMHMLSLFNVFTYIILMSLPLPAGKIMWQGERNLLTTSQLLLVAPEQRQWQLQPPMPMKNGDNSGCSCQHQRGKLWWLSTRAAAAAANSALRPSLKTGKNPEKDWTKTGKDWTAVLVFQFWQSKTTKRLVLHTHIIFLLIAIKADQKSSKSDENWVRYDQICEDHLKMCSYLVLVISHSIFTRLARFLAQFHHN